MFREGTSEAKEALGALKQTLEQQLSEELGAKQQKERAAAIARQKLRNAEINKKFDASVAENKSRNKKSYSPLISESAYEKLRPYEEAQDREAEYTQNTEMRVDIEMKEHPTWLIITSRLFCVIGLLAVGAASADVTMANEIGFAKAFTILMGFLWGAFMAIFGKLMLLR